MGLRKLLWQRKARKTGSDGIHSTMPGAVVKGTGKKAYQSSAGVMSPAPNSGVGKTVSLPISSRKRELIERWVKQIK